MMRISLRSSRLLLALAAGITVATGVWIRCGPLPDGFLDPQPHRSVLITDRQGRPLYEVLSEKEQRSEWLSSDALPEALVRATLAAEDRRFFRHPGIDPFALARAAWVDLRAMRLVEGGSTVTQQVAKRLMERNRSVSGKLLETLYALRVEHRLTKNEILALYLNLAPYGNQYAGAQAASRGYFGCSAANLTPAQAAFLAGLPQRPSALDPYTHLDSATRRQQWVLRRMQELGFLDAESCSKARAERLEIRDPHRVFEAPHFVERVVEAGPAPLPPVIRATLDLDLQRDVQNIIEVRRRSLLAKGIHNAAVIVIHNPTGQVLAWEGSSNYFDADHGGTIDGVITPRQPGSALKPFTYALAFESGMTPASVLPDIPSHFPTGKEGILYSPRNYDGVFRGPMLARAALAGSENVPAVWTLARIGIPRLLDLLRRLGLTTLDRTADYYGLGLTLGDAEVRLGELAAAYACLARGGRFVKPVMRLDSERSAGVRVLSERAAFWVSDVLADCEARAYAFGRGGPLEFPFPVAAKTGTSQGYADNWTIGYTRDVTVGVWVGNFDRRPLRSSSGVTGAAPIFHDVLQAALMRVSGRLPDETDPPIISAPEELQRHTICALSGMRAGPACPSTTKEWLSRPPQTCTWHVRWEGQNATAFPAEYRSWARERGVPALSRAATPAPGGRAAARPLAIENPPDGATFLIDPTLRMEYQALELRALCDDADRMLTWAVDGKVVGECRAGSSLFWPLKPGAHSIRVADDAGHDAAASFFVR